mgnify:FL=1
MMNLSKFYFFIIFLIYTQTQSQNKEALEIQKKELQNQIKKIEFKLSSSLKQKDLILLNAEDVSYKIILQQSLINNINDQLNLILTDIENNEIKLSELKIKESNLKEELSIMMLKAYKKRSNLNKIMYIFSSSSFFQAYKRIQYFKQYVNHQKKIIIKINDNAFKIKNTIIFLDSQKFTKETLIKENLIIQKALKDEYEALNALISQVDNNKKKYVAEIKKKQKLSKEIDKKIEKLIAEALSKEKKPGFKLTEEAILTSKDFNANKGKLPSPVSKGNLVMGFGKQRHPIVKTATIQSNGVRIRTSSEIDARTIFNGTVYSIIVSKNSTHTILVQHGTFFTVYKNLSEIYVAKGDKLLTKDPIGKIATDPLSGQTILSFSIFNNGVAQNPRLWIYKL